MSSGLSIACLYVAPDSIYFSLPGCDCWPESRDARLYAGPHPVVAHPPCGHWGNYRSRCQQPGRELAPMAIHQVERWGGVLEHPATSRIRHSMMPLFAPGHLLIIDQHRFGHQACKLTCLYFVRCLPGPLPPPRTTRPRPLEHLSHRQRAATPPDLAVWLVDAARRCPRV